MSIEKSFMRPNRASRQFTKTRRDCQIKPDSHVFPVGGIGFRPIPCGKDRYRLEPENSCDNICTIRDLEDEIRTASGLSVNVVESVLGTLLDVVPKFMARTNGCAVRLGDLVTLKPCITGSLDAANGDIDPKKNHLEIRATISPALRYSLKNAPLVNLAGHTKNFDRVMGGNPASPEIDKIDSENEILISCKDIYVPEQSASEARSDGRVWVETRDGRRLGACAVEISGRDVLNVRFVPDAPMREEDRECRIVVMTCGTIEAAEAEGSKKLFRLERDVTYIGKTSR